MNINILIYYTTTIFLLNFYKIHGGINTEYEELNQLEIKSTQIDEKANEIAGIFGKKLKGRLALKDLKKELKTWKWEDFNNKQKWVDLMRKISSRIFCKENEGRCIKVKIMLNEAADEVMKIEENNLEMINYKFKQILL